MRFPFYVQLCVVNFWLSSTHTTRPKKVQRHRRVRIKITKRLSFCAAKKETGITTRVTTARRRANDWKIKKYKYSKYLDDFIYDSWALTPDFFSLTTLIVIKFNFTTLSRGLWALAGWVLEFIGGIGTALRSMMVVVGRWSWRKAAIFARDNVVDTP